MDIFIPIFILFTIFVLCSLCGFCCKNRNEGAIFSTPVVITSQTHQPVGSSTAYPVGPHPTTNIHTNYYHTPIAPPSMPMPYSDNATTYPAGPTYPGSAPYPASAPYPQAPYPPVGQQSPYPPVTSPYPPQPAPYNQQALNNQQPPAYNEVVFNETHQKQAPYNPNFTG